MQASARSWLLAAAVAACGVLAGPIAVAQASNASIAATFGAANSHLNGDEAAIKRALKAYKRHHRAKPVIAALRHEVRDIRSVNALIKHQPASTPKGRRGKADLTKGLTLIANAYATLANDIHKAHSGHPVSPAAIKATVASDRRGQTKLLTGLRLLGVKLVG